jgi:hypothetical protein
MRFIYLYFLFCCLPVNAVDVAIPEPISICLWEARIASDLQFGRKNKKNYDISLHKATVQLLLEKDKNPPWYIKKILKIFDDVWLRYTIEDDTSFVFKTTYNTCILDYKKADGVYYY